MQTVTLDEVSYRVGGTAIVSSVTVTLEPGGLVAVIGPNGAGKTTLLRLIGGELAPTSGSVRYDDEAPTTLLPAELARRRALVTGDGPTDIPFPARVVVRLGRAPHRRDSPADGAIVDAVMESLGITGLAHRSYATLSSGERALVDLARARAQDTPILLLDEPTGALDVAVEERTMRTLRSLGADRLVVAVIHDLDVVARHADRVLVMHGGAVVADGAPQEALSSQLLTRVFGHPIDVMPHPLRPGPLIVVR